MVLYNGDNTYKSKPLFRGAIMNSGSIGPADSVDSVRAQSVYDQVAAAGGCSDASDSLECLRNLPYDEFLNAANSPPGVLSYSALASSYLPRADGKALVTSPDQALINQRIAKVPFIVGDQEDEGTLFALFQSNITTKTELVDYFQEIYFSHATREEIEQLVSFYDDISTYGSPFRTGWWNQWYPQFKQLAALLGDLVFTLSRRITLATAQQLFPEVPKWTYLSSYDHGLPILGTFHTSDILQVFYGVLPNYASRAFKTYYINFVNTLDPNRGAGSNDGGLSNWPQWTDLNQPQMLNMFNDHSELIADNFRNDVFEYLLNTTTNWYI